MPIYGSEIVGSLVDANRCVVRETFTSAAGLPADTKFEMDRLRSGTLGFSVCLHGLGDAAVAAGAKLIVAAPNGMNRSVEIESIERGVKSYPLTSRTGIPSIALRKLPDGTISTAHLTQQQLQMLDDASDIFIVEDATSTRSTVHRVAVTVGVGRVIGSASIVDRGIDVPGVETLDQVRTYQLAHPKMPPPHLRVPYPTTALLYRPLPLLSTGGL